MLLIGHDRICKEALRLVPEFLPTCQKLFGLSAKECLHLLLAGGHIPDIPKWEFTDDGSHVKHVQVRVFDIRKIKWDVSQVLHSHRGLGSLGHSMYSILTRARGPRDMGRAIVRRCAGWLDYLSTLGQHHLRLSLLGVIMHAVIDSYAPGHTFRLTSQQRADMATHACDTPLVDSTSSPIQPGVLIAQAILRLRKAQVKTISRDNLGADPDLMAHFATPEAWHRFWQQHEEEIMGLQYLVQFEAGLDRRGKRYMHTTSCLESSTPQTESYAHIIDFLSVGSTSFAVHYVSDWIRTLKKVGLYESAVQDVAFVLRTFLHSLTEPEAAIRHMVCYFTHRTFDTSYAIPLKHKIKMRFWSKTYCTQWDNRPQPVMMSSKVDKNVK